jgi:hypothetical protein
MALTFLLLIPRLVLSEQAVKGVFRRGSAQHEKPMPVSIVRIKAR